MSQPRRRRRKRRRSGPPSDTTKSSGQKPQQSGQQQSGQQKSGTPARRRRRRGRARGEARQPTSPKSSEDLVRAPRQRPAALTAPPDGQTLEGIIGELQSEYGVPQYPQEYRITIKVADDKDGRSEQTVVEERKDPDPAKADGPKREKAPAPPVLMRGDGSTAPARKRRRGRRGRRRRGGGSGGSAG